MKYNSISGSETAPWEVSIHTRVNNSDTATSTKKNYCVSTVHCPDRCVKRGEGTWLQFCRKRRNLWCWFAFIAMKINLLRLKIPLWTGKVLSWNGSELAELVREYRIRIRDNLFGYLCAFSKCVIKKYIYIFLWFWLILCVNFTWFWLIFLLPGSVSGSATMAKIYMVLPPCNLIFTRLGRNTPPPLQN